MSNTDTTTTATPDKAAETTATPITPMPPPTTATPAFDAAAERARDDQRAADAAAEQAKGQGTPPTSRPMDPVDHVDRVMRSKGYGVTPGEGVAVLLRHVAAQLGIHTDSFNVDPEKLPD